MSKDAKTTRRISRYGNRSNGGVADRTRGGAAHSAARQFHRTTKVAAVNVPNG